MLKKVEKIPIFAEINPESLKVKYYIGGLKKVVCGFLLLLSVSCVEERHKTATSVFHTHQTPAQTFDLDDIQQAGQLIALTLYGPSTYFEIRGEYFGPQYKLVEAYAHSIGVTLRVDVCADTAQMLRKLSEGDGDIVLAGTSPTTAEGDTVQTVPMQSGELQKFVLPSLERGGVGRGGVPSSGGHLFCRSSSTQLAQSLSGWLTTNKDRLAQIVMPCVAGPSGRYYAPRRHPSASVRNLARGEISLYDTIFKTYARACGWDWRLLAAQAFQESAFDPQAVSWMGALGLMQLMPSTARSVGVSLDQVFNPEVNVRGAVRLIVQLDRHYAAIVPVDERINFILAAYNAGPGHVDDARRLAQRDGHNPDHWFGDVDQYVLRMSRPEYYSDPLVRHGYFRGSETYNYVADIRARWQDYRRKVR